MKIQLLALILILSISSILVYYLCNFERLRKLYLNYIEAIKVLISYLYSHAPIKTNKIQSKLNKVSFEGIFLVAYIIKFLSPYIFALTILLISKPFDYYPLLIFLPTIPYIILMKKK